MKIKITALILVAAFGWSCVTKVPVSIAEIGAEHPRKTIFVHPKAGGEIELHDIVVSEDKIEGLKNDNTKFEIAIADISSVQIKKADIVLPVLFCGVSAIFLAIAIGQSHQQRTAPWTPGADDTGFKSSGESCPFFYSFDGVQYSFDADPIGGAICRGMERAEWAELDHLREVDGRYRLLVANELEESDFVDEVSLLVVDHQAGVRIVPDVLGGLHSIVHPQAAVRATDQNGRDLRPLLASKDDQFWESEKDGRNLETAEGLKDTLIFEFPKPSAARKATLVANAWTTIWGMQAVKGLLDLFGDGLPEWYADINRSGPAHRELWNWFLTGGMYTAKILVETREGWTPKGLLYGGGPYLSKDKAYPLDLSDVPGDTVRLKIETAAGFWKLDYLALDYGLETPDCVREIRPEAARDRNGQDVNALITKADQIFYGMPQAGDFAELTFAAPEKTAGLERTILLKVRGYYDLHNGLTGPGQPYLARQMLRDPAQAVHYALESYYQSQKSAPRVY